MRGKRTDDEVWVSVHLKWIQGAQRSREAVAWTGTVISSEYQRPGKHETEKVVDDPGVSTSTGNKQLVYRNSKVNLTWQAALTKVSRHSGDDSLRALVFYFYIYIYIYTQPWWLVAGVDNEKVVESPPKGGDQHLVNKTQPLTWTMTDNYKNTKMVTIKWIFLQQEKEDQY